MPQGSALAIQYLQVGLKLGAKLIGYNLSLISRHIRELRQQIKCNRPFPAITAAAFHFGRREFLAQQKIDRFSCLACVTGC